MMPEVLTGFLRMFFNTHSHPPCPESDSGGGGWKWTGGGVCVCRRLPPEHHMYSGGGGRGGAVGGDFQRTSSIPWPPHWNLHCVSLWWRDEGPGACCGDSGRGLWISYQHFINSYLHRLVVLKLGIFVKLLHSKVMAWKQSEQVIITSLYSYTSTRSTRSAYLEGTRSPNEGRVSTLACYLLLSLAQVILPVSY